MKYEMLVVAGRRGRGKTAYAVNEAIATLKKGRTVWANFPLDLRHLEYKGSCWFADELGDLADMRDGLFIVDEAHILAGGRWKSITRETHALIALSRHLRMRIIWISQNFRRLDPVIREITDGVLILHRVWRYSWGKHWLADEIGEEGRPKDKARSYDRSSFWHTQKLHRCYDDEELVLELLKNRKPRTWVENGVGLVATHSSVGLPALRTGAGRPTEAAGPSSPASRPPNERQEAS
jgi:hypothetical protein